MKTIFKCSPVPDSSQPHLEPISALAGPQLPRSSQGLPELREGLPEAAGTGGHHGG